jgi:TRAP-type C4-dicarboxylate transport system substrate-binding protein
MKIRCSGLITKVVGALGGAPVSMPMPETYDALSKGIIRGYSGSVWKR